MTQGTEVSPTTVAISRRNDFSIKSSPTRTGNRLIYAVGDIHGCYDLLVALLKEVVADVELLALAERPLLIFCGDYIDRGPHSSDVLTTLIWLSRHATIEVAFLRGNHEAMMLAFLDRPFENLPWLRHGGASTLRAYGIEVSEEGMDDDCWRVRDELMDRLPASHLEFLRALPTRLTYGDYCFVHAGVRPGVTLDRQDDEDCLWIREDFLESEYRFEKTVVHGHSWTSHTPVITPNRIGIDTGAYQTGVLTAVRLGTSTIEFIQARFER